MQTPSIQPPGRSGLKQASAILFAVVTFSATAAEHIPPPQDLYDGGDYYTLRDRSLVSLWRSAREIAVQRYKALPPETVSRSANAERLVASMEACGTPTTHQLEILSVSDAGKALNELATLEGVVWASPVLSVPGSGKRVLLCNEIALELTNEADKEALFKELAARGLTVVEKPGPEAPRLYLLKLPQRNAEAALAEANALAQMPGVAWAEPNFLVQVETYYQPNDPYFARQQSLYNTGQNGAQAGADVDAPQAWDIRNGHERLVIAIIDSGVDTGHPDLNIFRNDGEWGGGRDNNGVDDDGNGYVDDHQGWDFWSWDNDPNPLTTAGAAHGTSCAGVAGAVGNNTAGVAGAAPNCRILPVRISTEDDQFTSAYSIGLAIRYAAQFADVISCSWGVWPPSSTIDSAIDFAVNSGRSGRGCPVFVASGNDSGTWAPRTRLVQAQVPSAGLYRFGFRCIATGQGWSPQFAIDQVRVLDQQGYNHLWRDDFEVSNPGWTVLHQGANIVDWWRTDETACRRPGSIWCFRAPPLGNIPAGEWAELRSPPVSLTYRHILAFMTRGVDTFAAGFEIRLLDANGQFITLLGQGIGGGAGYGQWMAYPARHPSAIAVGACTDLDLRADYSNYGPELFCVAPSNGGWNDVVTTDTRGTNGANNGVWNNDGDYRMSFGGTSAATPLTAGIATLVLSKNGNLTWQQLKDVLRLSCDQIGGVTYDGNGWHPEYGYGRINAHSALINTPSDTTAPTVSSVVVRTSRAVEIAFSEPVGDGVITAANYTISGPGKGTLPSQPSTVNWLGGNKFLLEWSSGEMLAGTGNVTVTANASVKDLAGNSMGTPNSGNANGMRTIYLINCGPRPAEASYPIYPYESERGCWSGVGTLYGQYTVNNVVSDDGTPWAVYGNERCVLCSTTYPGDIIYTLSGISAGVNHRVRLYFLANGYSTHPGDVVFDVYINNVLKLANFDLIGAAGGVRIGVWREFTNITADAQGRIGVKIVPKGSYNQTWGGTWYYNATLSGIKVTAQ